jgi:hypothetical protein
MEELIYLGSYKSFLKQDTLTDRCELIIVNDYPLQTLVYNHPNITIINMPKTFTTIGDKEQYATYVLETLSANGMMMILHYQII